MVIAVWVCLVSSNGMHCIYVLYLQFLLASQAWTLATILPMIHWDCFLLLLQIIQISTAKVVSPSTVT